jgi:hypothetical protein
MVSHGNKSAGRSFEVAGRTGSFVKAVSRLGSLEVGNGSSWLLSTAANGVEAWTEVSRPKALKVMMQCSNGVDQLFHRPHV